MGTVAPFSQKCQTDSTLKSWRMECLSLTGEIWVANYTTPSGSSKTSPVLSAVAV